MSTINKIDKEIWEYAKNKINEELLKLEECYMLWGFNIKSEEDFFSPPENNNKEFVINLSLCRKKSCL